MRSTVYCFQIGGGPAGLDLDIAALGPAEIMQFLLESCDSRSGFRVDFCIGHKHAYPAYPYSLLRKYNERTGSCTTYKPNKVSSLHDYPNS